MLNLISRDLELAQVDIDGANGAVHNLHRICCDLLILGLFLPFLAHAGVVYDQVALLTGCVEYFAGYLPKSVN